MVEGTKMKIREVNMSERRAAWSQMRSAAEAKVAAEFTDPTTAKRQVEAWRLAGTKVLQERARKAFGRNRGERLTEEA
jgi:hypothetical protein